MLCLPVDGERFRCDDFDWDELDALFVIRTPDIVANSHFEFVRYCKAFDHSKAVLETGWDHAREPCLLLLGRHSRVPWHVHHRLGYLHCVARRLACSSLDTRQKLLWELVSELLLEGSVWRARGRCVDLKLGMLVNGQLYPIQIFGAFRIEKL